MRWDTRRWFLNRDVSFFTLSYCLVHLGFRIGNKYLVDQNTFFKGKKHNAYYVKRVCSYLKLVPLINISRSQRPRDTMSHPTKWALPLGVLLGEQRRRARCAWSGRRRLVEPVGFKIPPNSPAPAPPLTPAATRRRSFSSRSRSF